MTEPRHSVPPRTLERYARAAVFLLMLTFFAQGYFSSLQKSLTWDEPTTLGGGYAILAWGDYDIYLESPPLMQVLSAWGLYRMGPSEPAEAQWRAADNDKNSLGVGLTFRGGVDHERVALWARLPVLLLGTLLIGLVYLWGRRLLGVRVALAVTLLAAFSPNLIAHSRQATADLAGTFFMFAAVASFWWAAQTGDVKRWFLCGAATGLAMVAKFTALLLGPVYILLTLATWMLRPATRNVRWVLTAALPIVLLSWLTITLAYGFDPDLSLFRSGVSRIYSDHASVYFHYLLGELSTTPYWYYTIVAYLLKVPTAVLLLLGMAAVTLGVRLARHLRPVGPDDQGDSRAGAGESDRNDLENVLFLLIPVGVIVGASFFDAANIGLRRILPAFPFLLLFAGFAVRAADSRAARVGVGLLLVWAVGAGVWIYPHHLSFFNVVAGGPEQAPYLLDDSNIDWGQDLPGLGAWQRTRPPSEELRVLYFGSAVGPAYGVRGVAFDHADRPRPRPGVYAISVHHLVSFRKYILQGLPGVDWLTEFEPIERIGNSIYIYEFP